MTSGAFYSTKHPHEPEIPPALDNEGRCLVCGLLVQIDALSARLSALEHVAALADELRLYEPGRAGDADARARLFAALDALAAVDAQEPGT